tara:strand:- start:83 stop:1003 length:921 start_codon:yes stop_codon:yes gene_type:complete
MIDNPNKFDIVKLDLIAKTAVEGFLTGLHSSPYHGFSVEFAEHKFYNNGEDTKNIDWKLFARTEKLYTKKYQEETNLKCHFLIDTSSSMFYSKSNSDKTKSKIYYSLLSSLSLMNLFNKQRDAFGLSLFSQNLDFFLKPSLGNKQKRIILNEFDKLINEFSYENCKQTDLSKSISLVSERIKKRSLIIIFTDLLNYKSRLNNFFSAVNNLKFKRHEVIIFRILDKDTEVDFNFPNKRYSFKDMESLEEVLINSIDIRKEYVKEMNIFSDQIKLSCLKYKIDLFDIDINKDLKNVLNSYLLKRKKML